MTEILKSHTHQYCMYLTGFRLVFSHVVDIAICGSSVKLYIYTLLQKQNPSFSPFLIEMLRVAVIESVYSTAFRKYNW